MSVAEQSPVPRTMTAAEKGVMLAIMAHLVWGGMAVYFGLIRHISPVEIAVHDTGSALEHQGKLFHEFTPG